MLEKKLPDISEAYLCRIWVLFDGTVAGFWWNGGLSSFFGQTAFFFFFFPTYFQSSLSQNHIFVPIS